MKPEAQSDTPKVDEALSFIEAGANQDVLAHPEKWLINVARELERENTRLCEALEWISLHAREQNGATAQNVAGVALISISKK